LANGVLHHVVDDEAKKIFAFAAISCGNLIAEEAITLEISIIIMAGGMSFPQSL